MYHLTKYLNRRDRYYYCYCSLCLSYVAFNCDHGVLRFSSYPQFTGSWDDIPGYGLPYTATNGPTYLKVDWYATANNSFLGEGQFSKEYLWVDTSLATEDSGVVNQTVILTDGIPLATTWAILWVYQEAAVHYQGGTGGSSCQVTTTARILTLNFSPA